MSTIITLTQLRAKTALYWQTRASRWIRVIDTHTELPLWEFKRDTFSICDDSDLRRVSWTQFQRERLADTQTTLLRAKEDQKVVVLTVRGADVFLARLPQNEIVDGDSEVCTG